MGSVKANLPYYFWQVSSFFYIHKIPVLPSFIQQFIRLVFCAYIPYSTKMGKDVHFGHNGMGIVLHKRCIIGNRVLIYQHVTIGGRGSEEVPIIEDDVRIGAGAKILGGVRIGKGAKIGANAVVISDVPAGATAVGVPARVILNGESKL